MVQVKQITYKGGNKSIHKRLYVHGFTLTRFVFSSSKQDISSKHFKFGRKHQIHKSLIKSKVVPTTSSLE